VVRRTKFAILRPPVFEEGVMGTSYPPLSCLHMPMGVGYARPEASSPEDPALDGPAVQGMTEPRAVARW
jgi:hypothetical protein